MDVPNLNLLNQSKSPEARARRRKRRWFFVAVAGGFIALQAFAGRSPSLGPTTNPISPLNLISRVGRIVIGASPIFADHDRASVLILGMGGPGHDGPYLTDTIILASLKRSTNQVALVSIPRDLVVDLPGVGPRKINHANALAEAERPGSGGEAARKAVAAAFGVPVPHYVRVDFSGFEKLIDDLGGITVNVERGFTDEQFPVGENLFEVVNFARGIQRLDGASALRFARSRHGNNGEGSDFARARRQQKVLLAFADRALSLETLTNPAKIKSLLSGLARHVSTNLDIRDILNYAELARRADFKNAKHSVIDDAPGGALISTINAEGSFVLLPSDGTGEVLKTIARNVFEEKPVSAVTTKRVVRLELQNGTAIPGFAYETSLTLREKEFAVVSYGNASRRDYVRTVIYDYTGGAYRDKLRELAKLLDAEIATTIPSWLPAEQNKTTAVDFLVILGKKNSEPVEL